MDTYYISCLKKCHPLFTLQTDFDTIWQNCTEEHIDWIRLSSVLRPRQHSIGYMGDGFYRSKDPTNSIKVLKVHRQIKHTIIRQ